MNKNKGFFTMIDNDLVRSGRLKPYELAVYANLKSRKGNKQSAHPSHATIARETCMSLSKVKQCIKQLEELGLIVVNHRFLGPGKQTSNEYLIFDKLPGPGKATRRSQGGYEEYSMHENSKTNSSTKSNRSTWKHLKSGVPATDKQMSYLLDLYFQAGGLQDIDLYPELSDMSILDQVQAGKLIDLLFAQIKKENHRF